MKEYIQAISNRPYEYDLKSKKINQDYQKFEKQLKKYKYKSPRNKSGMMLGRSTAAGAGVALLGPNVALAAATTFGTASTGAAISSLSGAAAANAALAWLGGGALTVGGAGVVGGQALLALAGPVGIAIGISGAVAAGVKMVSDNKRKHRMRSGDYEDENRYDTAAGHSEESGCAQIETENSIRR